MSHVVRINDPSQVEPMPIVLYLAAGEDKRIDLVVENHGDPTNLRLSFSDQLYGALQLPRVDHYLVLEETIPILARMPQGKDQVEGELIFTTDNESIRIPVTIAHEALDAQIVEPMMLDTNILGGDVLDTNAVDSEIECEDMKRRWQLFLPVIPLATVALLATLLLTFSLRAVPEFPGALVSAILIVTLIIYGAATLLKA